MSSGKIKLYDFSDIEKQKMTEVLAYVIFTNLYTTCTNNRINFDSLLKLFCELAQVDFAKLNKVYVKVRFTPFDINSQMCNLALTYFEIPIKKIRKNFCYLGTQGFSYENINKYFNNVKLCLNEEELSVLKLFLHRIVYLFESFKYLNFNYITFETDVNRFITKDQHITKNKKRACEIYFKESIRVFANRIRELVGMDYIQAIAVLGKITNTNSAELKFIYDNLRKECFQDYKKQVALCSIKFNISDKDVKTFFGIDKQNVNYFKRTHANMTLQAMTDEQTFKVIRVFLEKIYYITRNFAYCNVNKLEV